MSGYDGGVDDRLNNLISLDSTRENKGLGQGIPIVAIVHAHQFSSNRTYPSTSLHKLAEQPLQVESSEFRRSSADGKLSKEKYDKQRSKLYLTLNAIRIIFRNRQKLLKLLHEEIF